MTFSFDLGKRKMVSFMFKVILQDAKTMCKYKHGYVYANEW